MLNFLIKLSKQHEREENRSEESVKNHAWSWKTSSFLSKAFPIASRSANKILQSERRTTLQGRLEIIVWTHWDMFSNFNHLISFNKLWRSFNLKSPNYFSRRPWPRLEVEIPIELPTRKWLGGMVWGLTILSIATVPMQTSGSLKYEHTCGRRRKTNWVVHSSGFIALNQFTLRGAWRCRLCNWQHNPLEMWEWERRMMLKRN